ncbi:hypothetical protein M4D54_09235 [Brachybacterium sp. p3-SID1565]|uniref:hypothetical protein n=1 Tax=Brachybacterium sp. p3-SID1565 TaxID=2916046 RepID=UPI0021A4115D|nr:hypothetical protein [Brachybacterium sp. p3-SID1565]MCT1385806.1 hypothetical protein [Brachybacterium sp. p3-SID1565]
MSTSISPHSPSSIPTRMSLEGGPIIDVDPIGEHLEVTIGCTGRARAGIALTRSEARRLATALLDASAPSLCDGDPAEIAEHLAALPAVQGSRSMTPAKAAAAMRAGLR